MDTLLVFSVACLLAVSAVRADVSAVGADVSAVRAHVSSVKANISPVRAETYPAKYDNVDVDEALNNKEKVIIFGTCLLDNTVCSENALKLKG